VCGLTGYIGFEEDHEKIIDGVVSSMDAIQHRGRDSWGCNVNGQLYRQLGKVDKNTLRTHVGTHLRTIKGRQTKRPNFIIGHVRAATVGAVSVENAHPFMQINKTTHSPFTLAHNGTVDVQAQDCCGHTTRGESDTAKLARAIAEHGFEVLKKITGSAAILAATDHAFYAYGSPLFKGRTPYAERPGWCFTSTEHALKQWLEDLELKQWATMEEQHESSLLTLKPADHNQSLIIQEHVIPLKPTYRGNVGRYANNRCSSVQCGWDEDDWRDITGMGAAPAASTSASNISKPASAAHAGKSKISQIRESQLAKAARQTTPQTPATPTKGKATETETQKVEKEEQKEKVEVVVKTARELTEQSSKGVSVEEESGTKLSMSPEYRDWFDELDETAQDTLRQFFETFVEETPAKLMEAFLTQRNSSFLNHCLECYESDKWGEIFPQ
jgi:hypothetical protein